MTIEQARSLSWQARDAMAIIHHEGYDGANAMEFGQLSTLLLIMESVAATMSEIARKFPANTTDLHADKTNNL